MADKELIRDKWGRCPIRVIAAQLGISTQRVSQLTHGMGLPKLRARHSPYEKIDFREGDAIITSDMRIGMISRLVSKNYVQVQFGSAGPFVHRRRVSLKLATVQQVKDAGMYGVGFNIRGGER
jgi:hypothetical protein